jgi:SAM-dependent methyltransferase
MARDLGNTARMILSYRAADISINYLPQRTHYWYSRCKLATDPLYARVGEALRDTADSLLDLGCGIGLLAHTLRRQGFGASYLGVDNDEGKIASARDAASRARLADVTFRAIDLARDAFPPHHGSVALLDVLQFLAPENARKLLANVARCIGPQSRLVIRTGLDRAGARMRFTRAVDTGSRRIGWMNAAPSWYPARDELEALFAEHRLRARFEPLTGLLPFNNWLIVAERDKAR